MAENYFLDNPDLQFHLNNVDLSDVVRLREEDYHQAEEFADAPVDLDDARDSYRMVVDMVGEICGSRIAPRARDVDLEGAHLDPRENGIVSYAKGTVANLQDLKNAEVTGVMLPRRFGGLNFPVTAYTMIMEMISRADASLENLIGLQDIAETINRFATEEQKQHYLPRFCRGEVDGAMSLTEPEAGSDLQAVQLKATFDPTTNQWRLNGMKRFITNGCARIHLVLARSEAGSKDGRGLSMFICERGPELVVRRIEDKLGIHGSPTCELQFNDAPAELVGQRRRGLTRYVMSLMNGARVAISSQALGIAEAAYREALKYARERQQFGKTIDKFAPVYEMLVDAKIQIIASRTLLYETTKYVDLRDGYEEFNKTDAATDESRQREKVYSKIAAELTPLCKALCTEMANKVTYDTIQIHGGTGFMRDFNAERYYRDVRITNIYEGTTQLQYIAAIGGIMLRVLEPLMDELSHLPFEGKLRRLASSVDVARAKLNRAIEHVNHNKQGDYFDLMARHLCQMETVIFVSYLMLRDAGKDKRRELLVEHYIGDMLPTIDAAYDVIMKNDMSLVDNHLDILAL